jgi:hypothetical protein
VKAVVIRGESFGPEIYEAAVARAEAYLLTKNQKTQASLSNNLPPPRIVSCPLPSPQFVLAAQYPSVVLPSSPNQTLIQEMLTALQPALDAISLKLELGLKTLKADLLEEMANLKDKISNQDSKIVALPIIPHTSCQPSSPLGYRLIRNLFLLDP